MTRAPGCIYRFRFCKGAGGAYVGELVDDWGWTIALRAEVVERDGVKVFEGTGTLTNATAGEPGAGAGSLPSVSVAATF